MRTYTFVHKNSSAVLTMSATSYAEAREELKTLVKYNDYWRCESEDGESEED